MPRRTLWTLVAAACACILVAGVPVLRDAIVALASAVAAGAGAIDWSVLVPALGAVAVVLAGTAGAGRFVRDRRDVTGRLQRLGARGLAPAEIARHTGVAQDAVRDALGAAGIDGDRPASPRPTLGSFFRRRKSSPVGAAAGSTPFADALRRSSSGVSA